jgi:hypothetical protein
MDDKHTPERIQGIHFTEGKGQVLFSLLLSAVMLLPGRPATAREQEGSEKKTDIILTPWLQKANRKTENIRYEVINYG